MQTQATLSASRFPTMKDVFVSQTKTKQNKQTNKQRKPRGLSPPAGFKRIFFCTRQCKVGRKKAWMLGHSLASKIRYSNTKVFNIVCTKTVASPTGGKVDRPGSSHNASWADSAWILKLCLDMFSFMTCNRPSLDLGIVIKTLLPLITCTPSRILSG